MKNKINLLIASLVLVVFSFSDVNAQKSRKMKKADQAFELELYSEAIKQYKKAYKKRFRRLYRNYKEYFFE